MTDEERRAKAAADKRAYRLRKKQEDLARQATPKELTTMFNEQARNIAPELEEAFRKAKGNAAIRPFPPGVLYQDNHKENAQAIVEAAEERHRRVELIMANYQKDAASTNALLWHLLETLTLLRLEIVDLVGGLHR